MPAPSTENVRGPAVAGLFYPEIPSACHDYARRLLESAPRHDCKTHGVVGLLLPHAGWICSGGVAAEGIVHAAANCRPEIIVVFGAVHTDLHFTGGSLDSHKRWSLPTGIIDLPREIEEYLAAESKLIHFEPRLHAREHSIEVELPLLQMAFPRVPILPMGVTPDAKAVEVGRQTARLLRERGLTALYVASSDLTHYGENYGLTSAGIGDEAMQWAKQNDRRILMLIERLEAEQVVDEAARHQNACGAGAIAAMLAASRETGATRVQVLHHTSSHETLSRLEPQAGDVSVGYAALAVG